MNAQQYFRECLEEHKRRTGETNLDIATKLGTSPHWVSMVSLNPRNPPTLSNYKALCGAISGIDEQRLLALIMDEQHPQAASDLESMLVGEDAFTPGERALFLSIREELTARGFNQQWELDTLPLARIAQHAARSQCDSRVGGTGGSRLTLGRLALLVTASDCFSPVGIH